MSTIADRIIVVPSENAYTASSHWKIKKNPEPLMNSRVREMVTRRGFEPRIKISISLAALSGNFIVCNFRVQFRLFYCTAGRNPAAHSLASNPPPR